MDRSAKKSVQQDVAVKAIVIICAHARLGQNQFAGEALAGGYCSGQPSVIGLKAAPGHQGVGALGECLAEQKLQLTQFVSTSAEASQVISLYVEIASVQL